MRTLTSIAVIVAAVVGIVALSLASARHEQGQLLGELTATTRHQLRTSVDVLSARLDALDQDTRVLIDVVERSRAGGATDLATERRIWASAFDALAVVVAQYRLLALFLPDGEVEVMASDPTESPDLVQALLPECKRLALEVARTGEKALGKPALRHGERSFLVYGTPVSGGGAIVIASDAASFLGAVAWTPLPVARLFVTDPAGVVWSGCETKSGCRAAGRELVERLARPAGAGTDGHRVDAEDADAMGLGHASAVACSQTLTRPTGAWRVTWVASQRAILDRGRMLFLRLLLTAVAAAIAVAGVGLVILRQQRKAAALESDLRYTQAVAHARQTSEAIVAHAPLGVLGLADDGTVVLANRFLTERAGDIPIGARLGELTGTAPWLKEIEAMLGADATTETTRRLTSDDQDLLVRIVPVRNDELGVRVFALVEDRSEMLKLEHQLVRAEKLITVGALGAGIAHELGSPLAVIRGRAEQVLREVSTGPRAEDLRVIVRHIDRISSTIRQVLDFSRKKPIEHVPVPMRAVVERAHELLRLKLDARHVHLEVDFEPGLPDLAADAGELEQVVVNLVMNACDASSAGKKVRLVAGSAAAGMVHLQVVDEGCGISAEHMNSVFDPFFTTKKRGEGTGLGLTIVASIVRNHGGEIHLTSTAGGGTTVSILWPSVAKGSRMHA